MVQRKLSQRDFDSLEAEMAMTFADSSLPMDKRSELQKRLEAIRVKAGVERAQ